MPERTLGDPTPRTLESLTQAMKAIEDKMHIQFEAQKEAVRLLQDFANRQPTTEAVNENLKALDRLTEAELGALKELVKAMFDGNKTALDAALKTQKEASDEIKANFGRQFDNQAKMIDDLKERINRNDGRTTGLGTAGSILLGVGSLIVVALAIIGFITATQP